jgi:hypothetical protein
VPTSSHGEWKWCPAAVCQKDRRGGAESLNTSNTAIERRGGGEWNAWQGCCSG